MPCLALLLAARILAAWEARLAEETREDDLRVLSEVLVPTLGFQATSGPSRIDLRYVPRLTYQVTPGPLLTENLQRASTTLEWSSRRLRLGAIARAGTGRTVLSPLNSFAEGSLPVLDRLSQLQSTRFQELDIGVFAEQTLSRRLKLRWAGGYGVSGGTDHRSIEQLPLVRSARFSGAVEYRSAKDTLSLMVAGLLGRVGPSSSVSEQLRVSWERQLTRLFVGSVSGGVAFLENSRAGPPVLVRPLAAATLGGSLFNRKLELALRAGLSPFIDPLAGVITIRPDASLTAIYHAHRNLDLSLSGAASRLTVPQQATQTVGAVSFSVSYRLREVAELSAGWRAFEQAGLHSSIFVGASLGRRRAF